MMEVYEFYNLGIGDPMPISASGKLGIGDMLDEVVKHFPESGEKRRRMNVRVLRLSESQMWVSLPLSISCSGRTG